MDKLSIIKEAIITEKKIGKLIAGFNSGQKNITRIDIDLTLENIRTLYDLILQLENAEPLVSNTKQEKKNIPGEVVMESFVESQDIIQNIEPKEAVPEKDEVKTTEEVNTEPKVTVDQEPVLTTNLFEAETKTEEKPEVVENPKKKEAVPTGVTMDLFGEAIGDVIAPETDKTIAETISETIKEEIVADVINKSAINDLKAAIGINEKFFFINELFDGNMKEYNNTIDALNDFNDKNEAFTYFDKQKIKYKWSDGNEAVTQLAELIIRKYGN